jgi:hypothetical protein
MLSFGGRSNDSNRRLRFLPITERTITAEVTAVRNPGESITGVQNCSAAANHKAFDLDCVGSRSSRSTQWRTGRPKNVIFF